MTPHHRATRYFSPVLPLTMSLVGLVGCDPHRDFGLTTSMSRWDPVTRGDSAVEVKKPGPTDRSDLFVHIGVHCVPRPDDFANKRIGPNQPDDPPSPPAGCAPPKPTDALREFYGDNTIFQMPK